MGIIGASRGLGAAMLEAYGRQRRVVTGFSRSGIGLEAGTFTAVADVTAREALNSVERWLEKAGEPRLVVVTAAVLGPVGGIGRVKVNEWAEAVRVNLVGAANVLHVLAPIVSSEDRVVFFTGGGVGGPKMQPRVSAYTASKAGLAVLLEEVASDDSFAAPVVGLAPGAFPTGFADEVLQVGATVAGDELLEQVSSVKNRDFDLAPVLSALDFIESPEGAALNGRIVSAQRDDLREVSSLCLSSNDVFRLRRVDDRSVRIVAPW